MLHVCQFMLCMDFESEIKIYYYYYRDMLLELGYHRSNMGEGSDNKIVDLHGFGMSDIIFARKSVYHRQTPCLKRTSRQ